MASQTENLTAAELEARQSNAKKSTCPGTRPLLWAKTRATSSVY
jgi:hypothetical protein